MSEVLSQSQIDALLNAARSGEMDTQASKTEAPEKKYRKYDFHSPKKFTKDRLKMISSVFEGYVRILSSRLNGLLHTSCDLEVDSVEEQRYYEFSNALTERDVITLIYDDLEDTIEKQPVLFHATTGIMLSMIDRQLGGSGAIDGEISAEYKYTDVELSLYRDLMEQIIEGLGSSWKTYLEINFQMGRIEVNPTLVQLIGLDETVVIVGITVKLPANSGRLSICLPGSMLSTVFTLLGRENVSVRQHNEKDSQDILDYLRASDLEVVAELAHTSLQLSDIYHLSVGDVVNLDQPKNSKVYLNIGGKRWFDGQIGISQKNLAVKIDQTYTISKLENLQDKGAKQ